MTVRRSIFTGECGGTKVTYRCDTQEELDEQVRLHDDSCVNANDTRRMREINRYSFGVAEVGLYCGAYSEDMETMCNTSFLLPNKMVDNDERSI